MTSDSGPGQLLRALSPTHICAHLRKCLVTVVAVVAAEEEAGVTEAVEEVRRGWVRG